MKKEWIQVMNTCITDEDTKLIIFNSAQILTLIH